ncbi:Heat shock 70 kDa protein 14 [Larimichthys crocea]|uniref:Uncharacterized protein n=1 Tax=Larimichthys crocea TaxID=215358 RepID=A0ACD3Q7B4_LARCR|nr:Heat shock 70 kDa protein 14 [Larimichthys crocea]
MKLFVCALLVGVLCLLVPSLAKEAPPKVQVYSRAPGVADKANIFICHVSGFHPPEIQIELLKDGNPIQGANQTDLAFEEDWHYHLTKYVPFTPHKGEEFACRVTHMGKPKTHHWALRLFSMAAIGVHFGYTCACAAIFKDGRADVVANDAGDRVTPAVVAYRDTEQIVGIAAKQGRVRNAANTVVKVKQVLGRSFDDPETQAHKAQTKCQVVNKEEKPYYEITTGEHPEYVAPEDAAKLIFHKMKETAQSALGSDVTEAVITVPFEFAHAQKRALREAAEAAGFHVLRLIHEPAAALLAYNIGQDCSSGRSHVLVYKLGGTSLSVTVLQVSGGIFRVLNTHTDHSIGGESFTQALAQYLATEFKRTFKHDVSSNARAMLKLMNGADMAKHSLSSLGSANCFVDSLHDGIDFECNVSRSVTGPWLVRDRNVIPRDDVVSEAPTGNAPKQSV